LLYPNFNQVYNFRLLDEFKDTAAAEDKPNSVQHYMEKYEVDEEEAKLLRKDVISKLGKTEIDRIQKSHAACSYIESTISRGTLTHLKTKDRYVNDIKLGDPYILFQ
jgi:hypothetical protein